MNTLTSEEMSKVVRFALSELSPEEQKAIINQARRLEKAVKLKAKNSGKDIKFGPDAALELLYCLGRGFNTGKIKFKNNN